MPKADFIVMRSSLDEVTLAHVTADVTSEELTKEGKFLEWLTYAVTEWIKDTPEGRDAWYASSQDFNVGDLSHYQCEPTLIPRLRAHGIENMLINVFSRQSSCRDWTYDTMVADNDAIEENARNKWRGI